MMMQKEKVIDLVDEYKALKAVITKRVADFSKFKKADDKSIFAELCFCILTPQSKAVYADKAIREMEKEQLLQKGNFSLIRKHLQKVRFPNNKAKYIIYAKNLFVKNDKVTIKAFIYEKDIIRTREFFVGQVKGIGFKEASHFLRNIGYGKDLAILDVHILNNLKKYQVIKEIPKTISKTKYYEIEKKMSLFSKRIKIPMAHLDLLFWAKQTGHVFK